LIADNEPKSDIKRPSALEINDLPVFAKTVSDYAGDSKSPYVRGLDDVGLFKLDKPTGTIDI